MRNGASAPLWWAGLPAGATRTPLTQDESVDVCIVGAGYTGLWTAYYLLEADPSMSVLVLDAEHVGFGASGRINSALRLANLADREERLTGRPAVLGRALSALTSH